AGSSCHRSCIYNYRCPYDRDQYNQCSPFSVLNRSSFGFWLNYFLVVTQGVIATSWFGAQIYHGSEYIYRVRRVLACRSTLTGIMCYLIYWLVQLFFMLLLSHQVGYLFMIKGVIILFAWLAMLIWEFGKVPPSVGSFSQHATLGGSPFNWAWLKMTKQCIELILGLRREHSRLYETCNLGTSVRISRYYPLRVRSLFLRRYGCHARRDRLLWRNLMGPAQTHRPLGQLHRGVLCLHVPADHNRDQHQHQFTSRCERFDCVPSQLGEHQEGQVLCVILGGWVLRPWEVLANYAPIIATGFFPFLNGHTIFIGPFTGIMTVDYWLVHRTFTARVIGTVYWRHWSLTYRSSSTRPRWYVSLFPLLSLQGQFVDSTR
ncbi:hypothetical protein PAXRUDRAFT_780816, partial [Paxillus rubicundulus Ve08.2h10]